MRSIIKYARTVQFNWVPGLAIEDMAADLAEKFGGDRVEFVNRHSWEA